MTAHPTLAEQFAADHRDITRGLSRLSRAVRNGDVRRARRIAANLDRLAGPHILFEEEVLYPYVAGLLGAEYAGRLYEEHDAGRTAIERLIDPGRAAAFEPAEREELLELLKEAVEHAATCATLTSRLAEVPLETQVSMQARLEQYRATAPPWTELPTEGAARLHGVLQSV